MNNRGAKKEADVVSINVDDDDSSVDDAERSTHKLTQMVPLCWRKQQE